MRKCEILRFFEDNKIERGTPIELINFNNIPYSGIFHGLTREDHLTVSQRMEEVVFVHLELEDEKFASLPDYGIKEMAPLR